MFFPKKTPPPEPEPNGLEIRLKLSESAIAKLIPLAVAVLVGSGAWIHNASFSSPIDSPANRVKIVP